jgi:ribosomal protein S30
MGDNISFVETEKIDENIQIILRQTDYTEEIAKEKLKEFNYDYLAVIRAYFGIVEKKTPQVKSVNQEIYKQLRYRLDSNMRNYQERVEKGEAKKI